MSYLLTLREAFPKETWDRANTFKEFHIQIFELLDHKPPSVRYRLVVDRWAEGLGEIPQDLFCLEITEVSVKFAVV